MFRKQKNTIMVWKEHIDKEDNVDRRADTVSRIMYNVCAINEKNTRSKQKMGKQNKNWTHKCLLCVTGTVHL